MDSDQLDEVGDEVDDRAIEVAAGVEPVAAGVADRVIEVTAAVAADRRPAYARLNWFQVPAPQPERAKIIRRKRAFSAGMAILHAVSK